MKTKALLYCTKKGGELIYFGYGNREYRCMTKKNQDYIFNVEGFNPNDISHCLNGTIPCECEIEVEEIKKGWGCLIGTRYYRKSSGYPDYELEQKSCLSFDKMNKYLKGTLNEKSGYASHISNLKVFDKPRELSDLRQEVSKTDLAISVANTTFGLQETNDEWIKVDTFLSILVKKINKAPRNMMNVWFNGERYVLISIQPQELCRILNGEQTILINKQVLNCMKGNE